MENPALEHPTSARLRSGMDPQQLHLVTLGERAKSDLRATIWIADSMQVQA